MRSVCEVVGKCLCFKVFPWHPVFMGYHGGCWSLLGPAMGRAWELLGFTCQVSRLSHQFSVYTRRSHEPPKAPMGSIEMGCYGRTQTYKHLPTTFHAPCMLLPWDPMGKHVNRSLILGGPMGSHVHGGIREADGRRWDPMGGHVRHSGTGSILRVVASHSGQMLKFVLCPTSERS